MNPRHRQLGLVLLSLVGSTLIWAGCAGMAEPLPSLAVAPASLTVSAKVGSASSLPVTITNTGQTPLSVTQAVLSGTGFSMSGLATPVTLPGGQSATFTVKFAASQVGVVNGNVEFMTDSRHAPHMLPLHGTGSSQNPVVASIVVSPPVATPAPSAKVQFTAAIQGATTNDAVTWAASIGTISATGVFTAPSVSGIGTIVATSVADPTKSATATVAVAGATPPPSGSGVTGVTVTPGRLRRLPAALLQFKASVAGTTSNTAVTWKALLGTITSAGSYTAPAKAGADTVTATSVADSTKSGSATVTVTAPGAAPVVTLDFGFPKHCQRKHRRHEAILGVGTRNGYRYFCDVDRRARHNQFVGAVHGASEGRHRHGYGDEQRAVEQICVRHGDRYRGNSNTDRSVRLFRVCSFCRSWRKCRRRGRRIARRPWRSRHRSHKSE